MKLCIIISINIAETQLNEHLLFVIVSALRFHLATVCQEIGWISRGAPMDISTAWSSTGHCSKVMLHASPVTLLASVLNLSVKSKLYHPPGNPRINFQRSAKFRRPRQFFCSNPRGASLGLFILINFTPFHHFHLND